MSEDSKEVQKTEMIDVTTEKETQKRERTESESPKLRRNPLDYTNFLFFLTFEWLTGLVWRGLKRPLELEDLWDLRKADKANVLLDYFSKEWEKRKASKFGLLATMAKAFGLRFFFAGVLLFFSNCFTLASPILLKQMLEHYSDPNSPNWIGYIWAVAIFVCQLSAVFFNNHYFYNTQVVALRIKSALTAIIYQKAMTLSNRARSKKSNGEIVNLMSIDTQKLGEVAIFIHAGWSGFLQVAVALGLLFYLIGWVTVVGLGVLILTIPLQGLVIRLWSGLRIKNLKLSDQRLKLITEILQGIPIIKFFNWEENYHKLVNVIRKKEVWVLFLNSIVRGLFGTVMFGVPILVSVSTFVVYAALGNTLHAAIVFSSISYFNMIRFPLMQFAMVIQFAIEGLVSINRIQQYLLLEENPPLQLSSLTDTPLKLENCSFEWDGRPPEHAQKRRKTLFKKRKATEIELEETKKKGEQKKQEVGKLTDINLEVKKGELLMIVGRVGSGKSSLLNGIIGEMRKTAGTITINGSIAYCTQQAWIQNATLRDNITFGKPFDKEKYQDVINRCALQKDLEILTYGDMTEIGEKGINISGGQRQRISLARAVYQDKDIYIFDDPLSAVDAHVGRHIFENCIMGSLKDKTRILVTHQLQYLRFASRIAVFEDGKILEQGTYEELLNKKDGHLQRLVAEYTVKETDEDKEKDEQKTKNKETGKAKEYKETDEERKKLAKLVQQEEREKGFVALKVIWNYCWYGGGPLVVACIFLLFTVNQAAIVGADVWMSIWIEGRVPALNNWVPWGYMIVYAGLGLVGAVFTFFRTFALNIFCLVNASVIFHLSFKRVLRAPKWFFDTTPVGRFLSRFSKDQEVLDTTLPMLLTQTFGSLFNILAVIVIIAQATPWFLIPLVPLVIIYLTVQQLYSRSSREIKRLESLTRSPLFAHFSESLNGLSTIRAYQLEQQFIKQNQKTLDVNQRCWFAQWMLQRWLGIRLELIGAFIIFFAAIFVVVARGSIEPGTAGLALSYALQVTVFLAFFVTQLTETEIQMNAVERLIHYTTIPNEPTAIKKSENEPPSDWPSKGEIVFDNYQMRYREGLELVLKGLNFTIKPQEKIGIVGRTGAGKSSTILALFRMMEAAGGSIIIDGKKISEVNLATLRKRLSIIPQEPVLFSGTVRSNLDPFKQYDDKHLWEVLQKAHLKEKVEKLPLKLDAPVTAGGENFSVGERQLLCLARALCKKTKILLIDEATANVDLETDALIQKTIDKEFADCTRLTIAHRLNTVMNSDRVLVMDKGIAAEFDTPKNLLKNPNGIFSQLVAQTGQANARLLRSMVFGDEEEKIEVSKSQESDTSEKKQDIKTEKTEEISETEESKTTVE